MNINKKDVLWSYLATFLKIASSVILFPFVLNKLPPETVGIWTIFISITALATLLDFGFNSCFTRNITYVFSGVSNLKKEGYETVINKDSKIDYGLLKGLIDAMRWFYLRIAIVLFVFYSSVGTYYINHLIEDYSGDVMEVYFSWGILCLIVTYNLYTLYYESLLIGKGLIKKAKKILIVGHLSYLFIATSLITLGYGLIAIVSAQVVSVVIIRRLSFKAFFTDDLNLLLNSVKSRSKKDILKTITPNAVKVGFTSLGGFMVNKSSVFIGSLFLSLEEIAKYGISIQLIGVIAGLAGIYNITYQPKIANLRILNNINEIKKIFLRGQLVIFFTFLLGGMALVFFGDIVFNFIGSQTDLISSSLIILALLVSFLERNHSNAGAMLLSKNEVPFFKASLLSGLLTILLLLLLFEFKNYGILTLIIAPGLIQASYQNWKWPYEVIKELKLSFNDLNLIFKK